MNMWAIIGAGLATIIALIVATFLVAGAERFWRLFGDIIAIRQRIAEIEISIRLDGRADTRVGVHHQPATGRED